MLMNTHKYWEEILKNKGNIQIPTNLQSKDKRCSLCFLIARQKLNTKCSHTGPFVAQTMGRAIALLFHDFGTRGVSGQCQAPAALYLREKPGTHFIGGWLGPRAGLDGRKISPHRDSIPGPSSPQSIAISQGLTAQVFSTRFHEHTQTHHIQQDSSEGVIGSSQRPLPDNTQHSEETDIHAPSVIRTRNPNRRTALGLCLRPRGHWDQLIMNKCIFRFGHFIGNPGYSQF